MRYVVRTLGCKANLYDSQLIEAELQRRGWLPASADADGDSKTDLCVVNSCTVTDEADRQSRKLAARLARENPEARVVITGCAAEVEPERLLQSKGIHYVIGNREKPRLVDLILEKFSAPIPALGEGSLLGVTSGYDQILSRHPHDREWPAVEDSFLAPPVALQEQKRTRAFLKIQEGCNSFCTYCIIPYGRGPSRSLRIGELVAQVRGLVDEGVREVVLTGTNIGDYGLDWDEKPQLDDLVESILGATALERLRVSSLDPTEISPRLIGIMASEPRLCPHFHVSLQSASGRVLRLMKRKYGVAEVESCLKAIAAIRPPGDIVGGVFVGMDVITGFPGEGEEEYMETLARLRDLPWSRLHVFPYSERSGTPATRLPGSVPQQERVRRARELQALSFERVIGFHQGALEECKLLNQPVRGILLEQPRGGVVSGFSANYLRVQVSADVLGPAARNQLADIRPASMVTDPSAGDAYLTGQWNHTGSSSILEVPIKP